MSRAIQLIAAIPTIRRIPDSHREPFDSAQVRRSMMYNAIRNDSMASSDLAGELERARRLGLTLADPADLNIVHLYIAELEARIAQKAKEGSPIPAAH